MNKQALSKISIAITSILLIFAASNEHFGPMYSFFLYIRNDFGLPGIFIFSGFASALVYLALSKIILRIDFKNNRNTALTVALTTYLLVLPICIIISTIPQVRGQSCHSITSSIILIILSSCSIL